MLRSLVLAAALAGGSLITAPSLAAAGGDPRHLTVVELFQSQGCSSCPPAIVNLNALAAARPDILALTFAVTYWDQLGWKDTFASQAQTARQWDYARGLGHSEVWTPQVVVDGRGDVVGARPGQIEALVAATPARNGPTLTLNASTVMVGTGVAPAGGAEIWLVRYDPRTIAVAVRAGENGGRTINHRNVVKQLLKLGRWSGSPLTVVLPTPVAGLGTAVLVQATGGPILAAVRG